MKVRIDIRPSLITNDPACNWNNGPYNRALSWLGKRWLLAKPVSKVPAGTGGKR